MKRTSKIIAAFAFFIAINTSAQKIIEEESGVTFSLKNMGSVVTGTFGGMKGNIVFDENNLSKSSFNTVIDASTINTNNSKRDKHLKKASFFEVETYPIIAFVSNKIIKKDVTYIAIGTLSMHGVSKEVNIIFTSSKKENKTILVGNLSLDRATYEIGKTRNIDIKITCVISE